jgi:stage V sporulation protein R
MTAPVQERTFNDLEAAIAEMWEVAHRLGLDPFPVHFELVPASIMYEFGAYGLPGRFSHWTHGKAYQQIKTMYDYGLSKIYELVINANPGYAFLLENNSVLQNKVVAAHVLAHSDFFKHNVYFAHTSRAMVETAGINAVRLQQYEYHHGRQEVEGFLDAVLSIQEHFDPNIYIRRESPEEHERRRLQRPPETVYDDLFYLGRDARVAPVPPSKRFPPEPDKDLLLFLAEHSPDLDEWQRDVLQIVRAEQVYFLPQMQTKIMNEGWAAYWHARIMRELDLSSEEYMQFASMHSSVLEPSRRGVNPYYVGMMMFEDIERRWDEPTTEGQEAPPAPGRGRQKIFEVRELDSDASFLRNYLTKELVDDLDLYLYRLKDDEWVVVEKDWEKVRDGILASMTNFGYPYIVVEDADYSRNRELYLKHCFEGQELDLDYADKTLRQVHRLWGRAVHLETVLEDKPAVLSFDGQAVDTRAL